MAILRNLTTDNGRKSFGMITLRHVRGRTIASQKRSAGITTRTPAQSEYELLFSLVCHFMRLVSIDIKESFDKSKYGSERNYFFKLNKRHLYAAFKTLSADLQEESRNAIDAGESGQINMITVPFEQYNDAMKAYVATHPNSIIRSYKSNYTVEYVTTAGWIGYVPPMPDATISNVTENGESLSQHSSIPTFLPGDAVSIFGTGLSGEILVVNAATSVVGTFADHPLSWSGQITNVSQTNVQVAITQKSIVKHIKTTSGTMLYDFEVHE
jgi:hypothetical protein